MRLNEFIFLFKSSLSPENYRMLMTRRKRDTLQFLLMLVSISLLLGTILSFPRLLEFPQSVETALSNFEKFNITGIDVELKEPVVVWGYPKVIVDFTKQPQNHTDSYLTITNSQIIRRVFSPSLFPPRLYDYEAKSISDYSNVLEVIRGIRWLYFVILIMVAPSVLFVLYLIYIAKYMVLSIIMTLIAFLLLVARGKSAKHLHVWRTSIYAMSPLVVMELGLSPVLKLGILPFLVYILLMALSLMRLGGKDADIKEKPADKDDK
ncbi:MAG: DUF1189 family protein [Nanoarchaeota archaeon]|nr:DUF1189 family protein [Nanoarchaeota archaeon]